jgi:hypothetical protein
LGPQWSPINPHPIPLHPLRPLDIRRHRLRYIGHIIDLTSQAILLGADKDCFNIEHQTSDEIDEDVARFEGLIRAAEKEKRLRHWRKKVLVRMAHNFCVYVSGLTQREEEFRAAQKAINDNAVLFSPLEKEKHAIASRSVPSHGRFSGQGGSKTR